MGEENHGCLKTALLGHDVQRALPSSTEVVDSAAVVKEDPTHLHNAEKDCLGICERHNNQLETRLSLSFPICQTLEPSQTLWFTSYA